MQPLQSARVLATCTWALERHWAFDAADTSTWSNSTTGTIEHVQAVGRHCLELLHQAAADAESGASSSSFMKSDPGAFGAEGSAASVEYHALLAALQLRVSALLTRGALCMSMALSRFDQAHKALDAARAILDAQLPGERPPRREGYDERLSVRALTLSTAGKVARYCGQLVEAEALLHEALDIWRACGERAGAAATLHELGVVRLRRADWAAATTLLQQSLDMKRELRAALPAAGSHASSHVGALKRSAHTRQVEYSYEEAATLHQLAVASMSSKPPRLLEAGALLREALALEDQGPSERCGGRAAAERCGARAATFQQLARVAERCGDHAAALEHLQEALAMHRRAYGEGVPHVNKAAVLSQLANLSLQGGEPDRAAAYLEQVRSLIACGWPALHASAHHSAPLSRRLPCADVSTATGTRAMSRWPSICASWARRIGHAASYPPPPRISPRVGLSWKRSCCASRGLRTGRCRGRPQTGGEAAAEAPRR